MRDVWIQNTLILVMLWNYWNYSWRVSYFWRWYLLLLGQRFTVIFVFHSNLFKNSQIKSKLLTQANKDWIIFFFQGIFFRCLLSKELCMILQVIFTTSHGQVSVERRFSLNKNLLTDNMEKLTIESYWMIKDHLLSSKLPPYTLDISNKMLQHVY